MKYNQILYIDIGNTLIKFALFENINFNIWKKQLSNIKLDINLLINELKQLKIDCIIFSSVKISKNREIHELANKLNVNIYNIKSLNLKPYFNFLEKKFIGTDIMCTVAAVCEKYSSNNIIISLGTATTISLVIDDVYCGSIIIPGMGISSEALFTNAELLKKFNYKFVNEKIKRNTEHAINLGVVNSAQKLISAWVNDIKNIYSNINFKIILTGGYCNKLNNDILKYHKDLFLVFHGMKFFLENNKF